METHVMAASFNGGPLDEAFQAGRKPRKEYKCHACDKVFKRSEHFTRHVRVHTKERPFSCRFCQKTYGRKDLVRRHEKTLHADLCEQAGDNLPKGEARQHIARRESEQHQHQQPQPPQDFNHGSFASTEPYPMHAASQENQLYSPPPDQSGNYEHPPGPGSLPHSDQTGQGEPLMIDPMLEEAFAGQGFHGGDQYGQNSNQHYSEAGMPHQSSPYYHHGDAAAAIPVDPSLDFGGESSAVNDHSQAPGHPSSSIPPNTAYGQYSSYQQTYDDYR